MKKPQAGRKPPGCRKYGGSVMLRRVLAAFALIFWVSLPHMPAASGEKCLDDVCFAQTPDSGAETKLRGIKLFEYWMFDLYTAALYLPAGVRTIDEVLSPVPKSLVLHYHRTIKASQMNEAAAKAMRKNPDFDEAVLRERIETIEKVYETVNKGDRYELRYVPEKGTVLLRNGEVQVTIPGEDFARVYFGIWLGHHPLNTELRDVLIGRE